jgi:hypothetical protein
MDRADLDCHGQSDAQRRGLFAFRHFGRGDITPGKISQPVATLERMAARRVARAASFPSLRREALE